LKGHQIDAVGHPPRARLSPNTKCVSASMPACRNWENRFSADRSECARGPRQGPGAIASAAVRDHAGPMLNTIPSAWRGLALSRQAACCLPPSETSNIRTRLLLMEHTVPQARHATQEAEPDRWKNPACRTSRHNWMWPPSTQRNIGGAFESSRHRGPRLDGHRQQGGTNCPITSH